MSTIEITPVVYGRSVLAESEIFEHGDADIKRPISFKVYLIRAKEKLILVDAGCVTMPGFVMEDFVGTPDALMLLGVGLDDITDLVITHAHHDHIECVSCFKYARVYIQSEEYELGERYFGPGVDIHTFDESVEVCENVIVKKIGGHSRGSCVVEISREDGVYVIAGDECYARECLTRRIPTGSSFDIQKSRGFIEKYASEKYRVLLCHDD